MRHTLVTVAVSVSILFLSLGCRGRSRHSSHATEIRFLHAAVDVGRVKFYVDDFHRETLWQFEMSDYIRLYSGHRIVDVWEDDKLLASFKVNIENGDEQTFALVGSKASSTLLLAQTLDPDGQAAVGQSRVTFLHTSPDAPVLDMDIEGAAAFTSIGYIGTYATPVWITVGSGLLQFTIKESNGLQRRLGPFTFDAGSRRDITLAVVNHDNVMELRAWDDYSGISLLPQSRLRVLNASPEAGRLEARVDQVTQATSVAFRESSPYFPAYSGTRTLEIRSGGFSRILGPITLQNGYDYTVAVAGPLSSLAALLHADGPYLAEPGTIAFDFLHLGPDAGNIDVRVNGSIPSGLINLPYLGSALTPPDAMLLNLNTPADRLDVFEVLATGTQTLLGRADLVPVEYGIYTVVLLGLRIVQGSLGVGDTALDVLVFEEADDGRLLSRMRTGHTAPTQGALTFKIDGALSTDAISPSLTYLGSTGYPGDYVHLTPGDHTLVVTATGSTATITSTRLNIGHGADTTNLLLEPSVATPTPRLSEVKDPNGPFPPTQTMARLRVHHVARGISGQALDVYLNSVSGTPLFQNITFSTVSAYAEILAGAGQSLHLTPYGNPGTVLYSLTNITFEVGRDVSFLALATNSASDLNESVLLADN